MTTNVLGLCVLVTMLSLLGGCGEDGIIPPDILPDRVFNYPASIGTSWVYKSLFFENNHGYMGGGRYYTNTYQRSGIQTWVIESLSLQGSDTLVYLASAKRDTVHVYNYNEGSGGPLVVTLDSTFVPADTTIHFSMRLSSDTISVNFTPTLYYWRWNGPTNPSVENFSRVLASSSDTVKAAHPIAPYTAHYVSGKGLIDCLLTAGGNSGYAGESLDLLQ